MIVKIAIKHIDTPIAIYHARKLSFLGVRLMTGCPKIAPMKPAMPMTYVPCDGVRKNPP